MIHQQSTFATLKGSLPIHFSFVGLSKPIYSIIDMKTELLFYKVLVLSTAK